MKIAKTTIALLMLGLTCIAQSRHTSSVYANFSGLQCDGKHQLCSMDNSNNNKTNALLRNNYDGTLSLIIDRSNISQSDTQKLFGENYKESFRANPVLFGIQKEILLTTQMKQELNTHLDVTKLSQGFYPIEVSDTHFIITFNSE